MIVIACVNLKGGVGKTSTTLHLGGTLAKAGQRVLLVDNDPQASLTQGLWGPDRTAGLAPDRTVAVLYRFDPVPEQIIHPTRFEGVWLIPGSEAATEANMRPRDRWGRGVTGLHDLLAEVGGEYDYTLIDCPPNLYLCSYAALTAATHALIPLQPEDYGAMGMVRVNQEILEVQAGQGGRPQILGYLISMFDKRMSIHRLYVEMLRDLYGPQVFTAAIPVSKDYKESISARQPVSHCKPKSEAAKVFQVLVAEIQQRLDSATATREVA